MRKHHVFDLALLAGLVVTAAACSRDTRQHADRKLDEMQQRADRRARDLSRKARDVGRDVDERSKDVGREVRDRSEDTAHDIAEEGRELRDDVTATGAGEASSPDVNEREARIATLDAVIATTETQPEVIRAVAARDALSATDRATIDDKLQLLQTRTDEAKTLIGTLREVEPQNWSARNQVIDDAMQRVVAARDDAWQALQDATDHTPTSMR